MQQRGHLIKGEQRGLFPGRFRKIAYDRNQRTHLMSFFNVLRTEFSHPGATPFRGTREIVHIEHRQEGSVTITYLESLHVRMINRNITIFTESQPVQLFSQQKNSTLHIFQAEVGLQHLFIEGVTCLFEFFLPVGIIPRHQLVISPFAASKIGHLLHLVSGRFNGPIEQFTQKLLHTLLCARHTLLEHISGIGLITQQPGHLQPQSDNPFDNFTIILFIVVATAVITTPQLLFEFSVRRIGHKRNHARSL